MDVVADTVKTGYSLTDLLSNIAAKPNRYVWLVFALSAMPIMGAFFAGIPWSSVTLDLYVIKFPVVGVYIVSLACIVLELIADWRARKANLGSQQRVIAIGERLSEMSVEEAVIDRQFLLDVKKLKYDLELEKLKQMHAIILNHHQTTIALPTPPELRTTPDTSSL